MEQILKEARLGRAELDEGELALVNAQTLRKLEAEVELKESQGQLHKLKTAIAEGKYIKAEEATRDLADFMAMFKKFAMNIPPRAVKSIAGYADPQTARAMERAMRKELEDMLAVFVDAAEIGPEEAEP